MVMQFITIPKLPNTKCPIVSIHHPYFSKSIFCSGVNDVELQVNMLSLLILNTKDYVTRFLLAAEYFMEM